MITLRELYPLVSGLRSDVLPAQIGDAIEQAAIKLARDSNLLRGTTFVTLEEGQSRVVIPIPPDQELVRIERVDFRDPGDTDQQWVALKETASTYFRDRRFAVDTMPEGAAPLSWALKSGSLQFDAPSDLAYPLRIEYSWAPVRFPSVSATPPAPTPYFVLSVTPEIGTVVWENNGEYIAHGEVSFTVSIARFNGHDLPVSVRMPPITTGYDGAGFWIDGVAVEDSVLMNHPYTLDSAPDSFLMTLEGYGAGLGFLPVNPILSATDWESCTSDAPFSILIQHPL